MGLNEPKKMKNAFKKIPGMHTPAASFALPADNRAVTVINDISHAIERNVTFVGDVFDSNEIVAQSSRILSSMRSSFRFHRPTRFVLTTDDGPAPDRKGETHELRKKGDVDEALTKQIIGAAKSGTTITRESVERIIPAISKKKDPTQKISGWAQFNSSRAFRHYARSSVLDSVLSTVAADQEIYTYYHGRLSNATDTIDIDPCIGEADIKFGHLFHCEAFAQDHIIIDSRDSDIVVICILSYLMDVGQQKDGRRIYWCDNTDYYDLSLIPLHWPNALALAIALMQAGTDYILHSCMKDDPDAVAVTYRIASEQPFIGAEQLALITSHAVKKLPRESQAPLSRTTADLLWNLQYWRICNVPSEEQQRCTINDLRITNPRRMPHLRTDATPENNIVGSGNRCQADPAHC